MKRSLIALAAATALGVTVLTIGPTFADPGDEPGPGYGYGMMGGYGPGYGMMRGFGPGYGMGPAMMGYGYGPGNGGFPCPGYTASAATAAEPLTLGDARKIVQQRLAWMGNDRLKLGKIEAKGDNAFVAEIVTPDNSLVQKLQIDRRTGSMYPVR